MVVDSSAVITVLLGEPESEAIARALLGEPQRLMSEQSALEVAIVIEARKGASGAREWELFAFNAELKFIPFTAAQRILAIEGWRRYGKGRHPAGLNIGDCCAYALAVHTHQAILYKGADFSHTNLDSVPW